MFRHHQFGWVYWDRASSAATCTSNEFGPISIQAAFGQACGEVGAKRGATVRLASKRSMFVVNRVVSFCASPALRGTNQRTAVGESMTSIWSNRNWSSPAKGRSYRTPSSVPFKPLGIRFGRRVSRFVPDDRIVVAGVSDDHGLILLRIEQRHGYANERPFHPSQANCRSLHQWRRCHSRPKARHPQP